MATERVPFDRRGYVILTLGFGERREVSGYGIEVLDTQGGQNEAGRCGRLYFALGQDQPDPQRPAEPFLNLYSGNRDMVRFDRIFHSHPTLGYALGSNPVRLKIFTEPKVAWTDTDPGGVPRVRHLVRSPSGGVALAGSGSAGDAVVLYRNDGQVEDRFHEDPQFDDRMFWYGVVTGTKAFDVYVETKPSAFDSHRQWVQRMVATDYTASVAARMAAFAPGPDATFVLDFTTGINPLTRASNSQRIPFPPGIVAAYVLNTDVAANTIRYVVGVVGHT